MPLTFRLPPAHRFKARPGLIASTAPPPPYGATTKITHHAAKMFVIGQYLCNCCLPLTQPAAQKRLGPASSHCAIHPRHPCTGLDATSKQRPWLEVSPRSTRPRNECLRLHSSLATLVWRFTSVGPARHPVSPDKRLRPPGRPGLIPRAAADRHNARNTTTGAGVERG